MDFFAYAQEAEKAKSAGGLSTFVDQAPDICRGICLNVERETFRCAGHGQGQRRQGGG